MSSLSRSSFIFPISSGVNITPTQQNYNDYDHKLLRTAHSLKKKPKKIRSYFVLEIKINIDGVGNWSTL